MKVVGSNNTVVHNYFLFLRKTLFFNGMECDMIIMRDQSSLMKIRKVNDMNKVMKMVTATVSHDLRSPLTSIN